MTVENFWYGIYGALASTGIRLALDIWCGNKRVIDRLRGR